MGIISLKLCQKTKLINILKICNKKYFKNQVQYQYKLLKILKPMRTC
jgi:hypothetical protein